MSAITTTDIEEVKLAREAGVLLEIEGRRIASSNGTIFVGCSDGDQFADLYRFHTTTCKCDEVRHHPLLLNGGALLLSSNSPITGAKRDGRVLLRHIHVASRIKGIKTLVLYTHCPCGVAYGAKLDIFEVVRLLVEAKLRIRLRNGGRGISISCFIHVDYGNRKRTYFVDRIKATEFLKTQGREIRS